MDKVFFLNATFKAADDEGNTFIEGYASTTEVDRVGDVVLNEAWTKGGLNNFKKNPIILFNHDYSSPIGKATKIAVTETGLYIKALISKASGNILELIKDGVLGAFSVGFRIKNAAYDPENDGFIIKDAELFEVSVVAVPANQSATFSLAKSFENEEDLEEFKRSLMNGDDKDGLDAKDKTANADETDVNTPRDVTKVATQEIKQMDPKELEALLASVAEKTAQTMAAAQAKRDEEIRTKAAAEAARVADEKALADRISVAVTSGAERLVADIEKRYAEKGQSLEKIVEELRADLAEKSEEIVKMRDSKRVFGDRTDNDWKKTYAKDMDDAFVLGLVTQKGWNETKFGKDVMEKVNAHSGVDVSSADFEQIVSTSIERDIENELILAPLFREIQMNSASLILPILPDAGYAEFTTNQEASGVTTTKGNLAQRGDSYGSAYGGVTLAERVLTTKKLISRSWLGNETEEDAILPILPLIRESMIRSHARAVENSILAGNHADGAFGTGGASYNGLIQIADADNHQSYMTGANFAANVLTASQLMTARKNLGKYGVRPEDVTYIVSQRSYFELIEDPEFQDMNLVGTMATKVTGQVGQVYGSRVLMSDEFATPATSKFAALAVYTRNYVRPMLRGLTVESDYEVSQQRRVIVASQRLGFLDLIDAAASVWGIQYAAA